MKIELKHITIRDLFNGYVDNYEEGVVGYGGKLDIRPKYQREFVYKDKQRDAVINTVRNNFPLNVLYWVDRENGSYEVLDGQQRILSICQYCEGDYSIDDKYFQNLTSNQQEEIFGYKLMVYFCTGRDEEKLDWFQIVNIAGEKLKEQEIRNAVYVGDWLSDAKRYFSRRDCAAYRIGAKYVKGTPIRRIF